MAKGQKKSNKEIRKPKQEKAKPASAVPTFARASGNSTTPPKRG